MATTYAERKTWLDEVSLAIRNAEALIQQAENNPTQVVQTLDALVSSSVAIRADITADATADANDLAAQTQKAEMDKLVADFTAKRNRAVALQTAVAGA
ncbi:MAG: hypothetical protein WBC44_09470 [Planctomycetaceae bacterium]